MKPTYLLKNNRINKQYEFHIEGSIPKVEYRRTKEKIYLTHTEIPKKLEGQGIASQLVKAVFEEIERQGLTLVPLCPFVAGYIQEHPEWKKLVAKDVNSM